MVHKLVAPFKRTAYMPETHSLISIRDVCQLTSLSRTAINMRRAQGRFPAPVRLGDKRVAFVRAEVEQWIKDRIAERASEAA